MNRRMPIAFAAFAASLAAGPVQAQTMAGTRMGGFSATIMIGAAANTDLQRVEAPSAGGAASVRRVTADTSPVLAAALGYWPSKHWGIRVHGSIAPTQLEVNPAGVDNGALPREDPFAESGARLWTADAAFMIRMPVTPYGRIAPYLLLGGGVVGLEADRTRDVAEATGEDLRSHSIEPAGVIGIGALVPLQRRALALTFELTDHIYTTPIRDPLIGSDPAEQVGVSNHIRLLMGLTVRFR